jgi:hypothetical protein
MGEKSFIIHILSMLAGAYSSSVHLSSAMMRTQAAHINQNWRNIMRKVVMALAWGAVLAAATIGSGCVRHWDDDHDDRHERYEDRDDNRHDEHERREHRS